MSLSEVRELLDREELGAHITVVRGGPVGAHGALSYERGWLTDVPAGIPGDDVLADAQTLMDREQNRLVEYGDVAVFVEVLAPPPTLVIFGAVHAAQSLSRMAVDLGFQVTVVDARSAFLNEDRFPEGARLLLGWPADVAGELEFDRRTYVVMLSHDARFERPVWPLVRGAEVKYLGAMGSRHTHAQRVEKLQAEGWSEDQIGRIHGPVGLDIGAETPDEMAIAILGEMIQVRYGAGTGMSLRGQAGRIHRQRGSE